MSSRETSHHAKPSGSFVESGCAIHSRAVDNAKESARSSNSVSGTSSCTDSSAPLSESFNLQYHSFMFVSNADGDYKKRAQQEYYEKFPNKCIELHYMDQSRKSMHEELQKDYNRNLVWARSLGIGAESI